MTPGERLLEAVAVMDRLRSPGGCPWDAEQTHESLRRYLIEECFELIEAIEDNDRAAMREELGDVLLQVLFHARVAAEDPDDPFTVDDVAATLVDKLVGRHPHVFAGGGDPEVRDSSTQQKRWEELKQDEKKRESSIDGVALGQPALALAAKLAQRTGQAGFPVDLLPAGSDVASRIFTLAATARLAGRIRRGTYGRSRGSSRRTCVRRNVPPGTPGWIRREWVRRSGGGSGRHRAEPVLTHQPPGPDRVADRGQSCVDEPSDVPDHLGGRCVPGRPRPTPAVDEENDDAGPEQDHGAPDAAPAGDPQLVEMGCGVFRHLAPAHARQLCPRLSPLERPPPLAVPGLLGYGVGGFRPVLRDPLLGVARQAEPLDAHHDGSCSEEQQSDREEEQLLHRDSTFRRCPGRHRRENGYTERTLRYGDPRVSWVE
ncbi:hypothetical protein GCM10029964_006580 [Kibdelosporangium lantanae]